MPIHLRNFYTQQLIKAKEEEKKEMEKAKSKSKMPGNMPRR
tara:strand:- start:760 stop:882 length:123 start_codon:yes stop_codon:yes gene_type:complete